MTASDDHVGFEVARIIPLVVLVVAGEPARLEALTDRLVVEFPGERFIGITSADSHDVARSLAALAPVLDEVIFTDAPGGELGAELATRALEEFGMGQDFVFTVAELPAAIRYGIDVLVEEDGRGWEGTAVLVIGSGEFVAAARQAIAPSAGDTPG